MVKEYESVSAPYLASCGWSGLFRPTWQIFPDLSCGWTIYVLF